MGIEVGTALLVSSIVGAGATAYGTIKSQEASKKQVAAQNRAISLQQRGDEIKQARERRQIIREQRIRQASAIQAGANQGASATSAVLGGQASLQSQANSSLSFLDQVGGINRATTDLNRQANKFGSQAQTYAGVANLGATIFSAAGGFGTIFEGVGMKGTQK